VATLLHETLSVFQHALDAQRVRPAPSELEQLVVDVEPSREPLHRVARGSRSSARDLAQILLREAAVRELGLGEAGCSAERAEARPQRLRTQFPARMPVGRALYQYTS